MTYKNQPMSEHAFEVMQMLTILKENAHPTGIAETTINNTKSESFSFVIQEAIDLIIILYGGTQK